MADAARGFKRLDPHGQPTSARRRWRPATSLQAGPCRIVNSRLQGSAQIASRRGGDLSTSLRDWGLNQASLALHSLLDAPARRFFAPVLQGYKERGVPPGLQAYKKQRLPVLQGYKGQGVSG